MAISVSGEEGLRKEGGGVAAGEPPIREILDTHSLMLRAILAILQEEKEDDGQSLSKTIQALVAALGEQSRALKDIGVALAKLGRDLPLDVVQAIDDNLDVGRRAAEPGSGHAGGNGHGGNGGQPS